MREINGIIPVVLTPLREDKSIDVEGLVRIVEFLHTKDVGGLWVLGTGSEDMHLSLCNRHLVAQTVCEANNGKLPLILGTGFFAMDEILAFMDLTKRFIFDAYHVMPYNSNLSLDRLDWFYRYIADRATKPLWMYTSGNWSKAVTPEFVYVLSYHSNIAGIKFSNTNTKDLLDVISLAREDFQVITAVASQLYTCLELGVYAHTSSLACCLPEPMTEILYDTDYALEKQRILNDFLTDMAGNTKKDNFLQAADEKYILHLRGICDTYMTDGYREIDDEEKRRLVRLLKEYGYGKFIG